MRGFGGLLASFTAKGVEFCVDELPNSLGQKLGGEYLSGAPDTVKIDFGPSPVKASDPVAEGVTSSPGSRDCRSWELALVGSSLERPLRSGRPLEERLDPVHRVG